MISLNQLQAALVRHAIATPAQPLPPAQPGITWIWAANGIFKRGVDVERDLLICVQPHTVAVPGLAALIPYVRYQRYQQRFPALLLSAILTHARRAFSETREHLIEQQYHLVYEQAMLRVRVPLQEASASRVSYQMPDDAGAILLDLHSHHHMAAYFSSTDDRDDQGLSVSAVIGRIDTRPEICMRLNVYGHHQTLPATVLFERIDPFADVHTTREGRHADA
jgi:PRTRC genetic system protein A